MEGTKANPMTNRQLAEKIAERLFTNGSGKRAERLKLVIDPAGSQPERDLGGWGERAAADQIEKIMDETAAVRQAARKGCRDCGTTDMPIDCVLTLRQWELICPEGGVLCASCIAKRASKLPDVINLTCRISFVRDFKGDAPGGLYFQFLKRMDANDECQSNG
jgi:hypothetical protein